MEDTTDSSLMSDDSAGAPTIQEESAADAPASELALVKKLQATIAEDAKHYEKAFKRMKRDMLIARRGYDDSWTDEQYSANITGRHIRQKTDALYAKNPKVTAKRKDTLDFAVWDESPQSLQIAMQGMQMAQQAAASAPQTVDPVTGESVAAASPIPPELEGALQQGMALLADYQQGMQRRNMIEKFGKTLEVLFNNAMTEQKPLDFKTSMKKLVRRACTTGVGYLELGFQRETGPRPELSGMLADAQTRLDHLRGLLEDQAEGEIDKDDPEMAELEASIASLQAEPEIVLREGLVFDFPRSTKVIPDQLCYSIVGFIGARHVTVEYEYTAEEVEERFPGVDLGDESFVLQVGGEVARQAANLVKDDDDDGSPAGDSKAGKLVRVWKMYDKPSGLVYYMAEGYKKFLRPPAAPDVFVEDFWPIYALTFNDVEDEKDPFPPSDVTLMLHQQREYNRARQGTREHRTAARPRWVASRGAFTEEDQQVLKTLQPFETGLLNIDPQSKIQDMLQPVPIPGVDPNLYQTQEIFTDTQLVVGAQEAQFGGVSKATATESAIAASATASSGDSGKDDLDVFLSTVARAAGQILMKEMSPEQVTKIVGVGAVWPQQSLADIAGEVYLEVEAGSSGKPNQAVEIANWDRMLPYMLQMPGLTPEWVARETVRRLDDKADLTKALTAGIPSIVMMNSMKQVGTGDAATSPEAQGPAGAQNAPAPPAGPGGSDPAFGSNQV